MRFSIVIPTYNNLKYLKLLLHSINNNSYFKHQILIHINSGSDGTLDFIKKKKIKYTLSETNIGLCHAVNKAAKLASTNYIIYAHDDMYFCKNWDLYLTEELKKYHNNLFYISGITVSANKGLINYNCGNSPRNFKADKFNNFCLNNVGQDLYGSHWAPHVIHKKLWYKVGGFSPEFSPGDGSDPDLCLKLWNIKVRIFKGIAKWKVYHFSSKTIRSLQVEKNNGTKKFLLKWGFTPSYFRRFYLQNLNYNFSKPRINIIYLYYLLINKLKYIYYKVLDFFYYNT